ncbi:MAG: hypothetical protein K0R63_878 [Rickettsiales bacterium]|jgi:hypothetical protein|nr:hypothetical protein [Rickettsiales bacterium]
MKRRREELPPENQKTLEKTNITPRKRATSNALKNGELAMSVYVPNAAGNEKKWKNLQNLHDPIWKFVPNTNEMLLTHTRPLDTRLPLKSHPTPVNSILEASRSSEPYKSAFSPWAGKAPKTLSEIQSLPLAPIDIELTNPWITLANLKYPPQFREPITPKKYKEVILMALTPESEKTKNTTIGR